MDNLFIGLGLAFVAGVAVGMWFVNRWLVKPLVKIHQFPKSDDKAWEEVPKQNCCTCSKEIPWFCSYCIKKQWPQKNTKEFRKVMTLWSDKPLEEKP